MNETMKEAAEVLLADRTYLYTLLHKVFGREPDAEMLEILTSEATAEAFSLLSEEEGDVMSKVPAFLAEVKNDASKADFIERVREEYNRLFVGPVKLVAPPWESVYRGKEAMLFQESTLEVRQAYRKYGLKTASEHRVADDSLALELDFMRHLAVRAQEALAAGDDAAVKEALTGSADFLREHLLVWIPKFLDKMKDAPTDCLYPQMSLILSEFLPKDGQVVSELLGAIV